MAVEGEFPKADGDYLFASEANRFARAGEFIEISSGLVTSSGTADSVASGSVLIGAGVLSNPAHIIIDFVTASKTGSNPQPLIKISGLSDFESVGPLLGAVNVQGAHGRFDAVLGSPGSGYISLVSYPFNDGGVTASNAPQGNTNLINDFNTGSPVVIFFKILVGAGAGGSAAYTRYSVQSFRGVV